MSSLLSLNDIRRYHLYRKETDMRKSFDALCGIISSELDENVMNGDVFIFINKLRTHLKMLVWEPVASRCFTAGWSRELLNSQPLTMIAEVWP